MSSGSLRDSSDCGADETKENILTVDYMSSPVHFLQLIDVPSLLTMSKPTVVHVCHEIYWL